MDSHEGELLHQIIGYIHYKNGLSVNTEEIASAIAITRDEAYRLTYKLIEQGDVYNCSSKDNKHTLDIFSIAQTKAAFLSGKYRQQLSGLLTHYGSQVKIPTLFLSYSWANQAEAETIYNDLTLVGIKVRKDTHDLTYRDNIEDFMRSIRDADYAIILLSDAYLKSKNCFNEVQHLLKEQDVKKKILPVILDGTKIFSASDRLTYIQYWEEQQKVLRQQVEKVDPLNAIEVLADLKSVGQIAGSIDAFLKELTRMLTIKYSALKTEKYLSLLKAIGFEDVTWATDLLEIIALNSLQDREIALDSYLIKHSANTHYYALKASTSQKSGRFDHAKFNFQQAIKLDSKNVEALNNLGFLLETHYQEFQLAKEYYEAALKVDPTKTNARINLANVLAVQFKDIEVAKKHYEMIIEMDPTEQRAYNNLANLYRRDFHNLDAIYKAINYFQKALQLNPDYVEANINYGSLLKQQGKIEEATIMFEQAKKADKEGHYTDLITSLTKKASTD